MIFENSFLFLFGSGTTVKLFAYFAAEDFHSMSFLVCFHVFAQVIFRAHFAAHWTFFLDVSFQMCGHVKYALVADSALFL